MDRPCCWARPAPLALLTGLVLILVSALPAFAVQEHRGAEGMVAHQLGHLLLIAGCGVLFRHSQPFAATPGWRQFRLFLSLLICWNLLAFAGHLMDPLMEEDRFLVRDGRRIGFLLSSFDGLLYYLSRLDHLILVPAFLQLLCAINSWRRQP